MKKRLSVILPALVVSAAIGVTIWLNLKDWNKKEEIALPLRDTCGAVILSDDIVLVARPYLEYQSFQDSVFSKLVVCHTEKYVQFWGMTHYYHVCASELCVASLFQKIVRVEHGLSFPSRLNVGSGFGFFERDMPRSVILVAIEKGPAVLFIGSLMIILVGIGLARIINRALG